MTNELFIKIVVLIVALLWTIGTAYLIPLVNTKVSASDLEQLYKYITIAVRCAEQIYTVDEWQQKKAYVMEKAINFVNDTLKIHLALADIDTIVEGIVNEVKR